MNKWIIYEQEKRKLQAQELTPAAYDNVIIYWSAAMTHNRFKKPGFTDFLGVFNSNIRTREDRLPELLKGKKPRVIQIWNDLFHEQVPDKFIEDAYYNFARSPHNVLVLTKRAKRMAEIVNVFTPKNIWNGVTCENQPRLDERIPYLLQVPGKRWLSFEPLLGNINFTTTKINTFGSLKHLLYMGYIHQIVVGCETGPHARLCKIEWLESIVEQCRETGVPCFVKAINLNGKIISDITKFPESLRVRELQWKEL